MPAQLFSKTLENLWIKVIYFGILKIEILLPPDLLLLITLNLLSH